FVPTDVTNYNSLTGSSAGSFVIEKATPTISVTNSPLTFNGTVQTALISSSISGTTSNIKYNGSSTAPTNAGTYSITADFVPTDVTNYNSLTGSSAGNFQINPMSIRIIADAVTKTENDPDPPFNYTSSPSLLNSASFTGSLGRAPGETPADYIINLGSLNAGINYVLSINTAFLTIKPLVTNYIFEVPNAFTPNLDGTNDILYIIKNYRVTDLAYFRIFNRTGQMVFESRNFADGWNGKKMGDPSGNVLESDMYIWIAEFTRMNDTGGGTSIERKTGSVLLLK
ncbi:MAG: gliding motility-associated C-terminal domain-containing protein, partial [Sediminibacterium sp.]